MCGAWECIHRFVELWLLLGYEQWHHWTQLTSVARNMTSAGEELTRTSAATRRFRYSLKDGNVEGLGAALEDRSAFGPCVSATRTLRGAFLSSNTPSTQAWLELERRGSVNMKRDLSRQ